MFQPGCALPIKTWMTDKTDLELFDLLVDLQTIAFEPDLTNILPAIASQIQEKIEIQRFAQIPDNEDLPPVARPVPNSPPVPSWRDNSSVPAK